MAYGFLIDTFLAFTQPLFPYTFDPVFGPLLGMGSPLTGARLTVAAISVLLAGLLSLLYYWLMDLEAYEEFKEKRSNLQDKMQEARDEGNTEEASKYTKEMMEMNMENMRLMLKPMLVSMVLFFLILPWMYTTFNPVVPMQETGAGVAGTLQFNGGGETAMTLEQRNNTSVIVVDGETLAEGDRFLMEDLPWKVQTITADEEAEVKVAAEIIQLPANLPLVGDELGWLGSYILIVIPLTFIFRKKLGIQ